jgi:hypothetical protein
MEDKKEIPDLEDVPTATPAFARHSWRLFQNTLDPLGRPAPLPQPECTTVFRWYRRRR